MVSFVEDLQEKAINREPYNRGLNIARNEDGDILYYQVTPKILNQIVADVVEAVCDRAMQNISSLKNPELITTGRIVGILSIIKGQAKETK